MDISPVIFYMGVDPQVTSGEMSSAKSNYEEGTKLIKRGEKHLKAQHLLEYSLKDNVIKGRVQASQRQEIWSVQVSPSYLKLRHISTRVS